MSAQGPGRHTAGAYRYNCREPILCCCLEKQVSSSRVIGTDTRLGGCGARLRGDYEGMKKTLVLGALLALSAAGRAQESRQDASVGVIGTFAPEVHGVGGVQSSATKTIGFLGSYRYMLTPRSALEANYSFAQYSTKYLTGGTLENVRVHTRQQEVSAAYVYSLNFRNLSPYIEGGPAAIFFSPILDSGTSQLSTSRKVGIGAVFGAGVAYELSPSFDIRAGYRGFAVKVPNFGQDALDTKRYEVISMPTVGVAYHF